MAGKSEAFSDDENRLLRAALRQFQQEKGLTQGELGAVLGIKQQNVGRLLNPKNRTGLARPTANALARAIGYRDAEHFLLEHGALAEMKTPPAGAVWADRDFAVRIATRLTYDQAAIAAVLARFTDSFARSRPAKWWLDKFYVEERERAADRAVPPPRATEVPISPVKRRRRA